VVRSYQEYGLVDEDLEDLFPFRNARVDDVHIGQFGEMVSRALFRNRTVWYCSNALDLHSVGSRFEFPPGHRLS
jgi:hypothetical protein